MNDKAIQDNYNSLGSKIIEDIYCPDYLSIGGPESTDQLVDAANITANSRVLDVGCGLGGPAMHLAQSTGCHVTGLDLVQSNIDQALLRASRRGLATQTHFVCGDACAMPFTDASFDTVIGQDAWCHIPDKSALLTECRRVLQDSGMCVFTDWVQSGTGGGAPLEAALSAAAAPRMGTSAQYLELLTQGGFEVLGCDDISASFVDQYRQVMARLRDGHDQLAGQTSEKVARIVADKNGAIFRAFENGWIGGVRIAARKTAGQI